MYDIFLKSSLFEILFKLWIVGYYCYCYYYYYYYRYVHLCMYVLPLEVEAFGVAPAGNRICAVGIQHDPEPLLEISILKIPDKVLTSDPTLEGYLNGRDFSVQAGVRKKMSVGNEAQDEMKVKSVSRNK